VKGNVSAGEALLFGKVGCAERHMVRGRGGYLGPDLSDIGASRRVGELEASLTRSDTRPSPDFRPALINDSQNRPLRAVAKHISPWSAILLDEKGTLHLLHGEATRNVKLEEKSWMPNDYAKRLSPEELTDLLAYVSRQAVRAPAPGADTAGNVAANE
jgi:hypothetical protein